MLCTALLSLAQHPTLGQTGRGYKSRMWEHNAALGATPSVDLTVRVHVYECETCF